MTDHVAGQIALWASAYGVALLTLSPLAFLDGDGRRRSADIATYGINSFLGVTVGSFVALSGLFRISPGDDPVPYLWGGAISIAIFAFCVHLPLNMRYAAIHGRYSYLLTRVQIASLAVQSFASDVDIEGLAVAISANDQFLSTWGLKDPLQRMVDSLRTGGVPPVDLARNVSASAMYVQVVHASGVATTPHQIIWQLVSGAGLAVAVSLAIQLALR